MKKIAIVDPSSYTLPYDYYYLIEVAKYYHIDFYYSKTQYNYSYIEKLRNNEYITLNEYAISSSITNKFTAIINYIKMLFHITKNQRNYQKIHFMWNLFLPLELPLLYSLKYKMIFTFHNDVPHSYSSLTYWPYRLINKLVRKKIFVSSFTQEKFLKHYKNIGEYHLVNHGILPLEDFEQSTRKICQEVQAEIYFWGRIEAYKGVDLFIDKLRNHKIRIYGKWSSDLIELKNKLIKQENIEIKDTYLNMTELSVLMSDENIFILPYKDATQSGILYTLLAYGKVFISSNVGENSKFLRDNDLSYLIFERSDEASLLRALECAKSEYWSIKEKLKSIKEEYRWKNILTEVKAHTIYE